MIEILIENRGKIYIPLIEGEVTLSLERKGVPGTLSFNVLKDNKIAFSEGNAVRLKVDGKNIFYGFVFKKQRKNDKIIKVTAYDQLRYLKNSDTYVYKNKTASQLIKMIANDFNLKLGSIADTKYKIKSRVEENTSLFDMIGNALDITLQNKKTMFVLYDDFGKLTLKNISKMTVPIVIDEETGQNFNYTSSIDENTYNKIKLTYDNKDTGKREVFIAKDSKHMGAWGTLQYFETLQDGENGKSKADALLKLYNQKTRHLSIDKAFGDIRVRAGSMVAVRLDLGDIETDSLLLVEKCKHIFEGESHFMDLTLRGGDFVA